jgi:hypothetical protein
MDGNSNGPILAMCKIKTAYLPELAAAEYISLTTPLQFFVKISRYWPFSMLGLHKFTL